MTVTMGRMKFATVNRVTSRKRAVPNTCFATVPKSVYPRSTFVTGITTVVTIQTRTRNCVAINDQPAQPSDSSATTVVVYPNNGSAIRTTIAAMVRTSYTKFAPPKRVRPINSDAATGDAFPCIGCVTGTTIVTITATKTLIDVQPCRARLKNTGAPTTASV